MEAMLVVKNDELSLLSCEPGEVIEDGLNLLYKMAHGAAPGEEERRVTLRKAGVLHGQVLVLTLVPVVGALTAAEIEAGSKPDAECNPVALRIGVPGRDDRQS